MPLFVNPDQNQIILANYKVMYSTLRFQENLSRTDATRVFKFYWKQRLAGKRPAILLIVRNPYYRLISFYEDKLANPRYAYDPLTNSYTREWQENQKIMFPYLGLEGKPDEAIKEGLQNTTFRRFVLDVLPNIYLQDGHLSPQVLRQTLKVEWKGISFRYSLPGVIHMPIEKLDKAELQAKWGINAQSRENATKKNKSLGDYYDSDTLKVVNTLYSRDFIDFGYQQIHQI